MNGHILNRYSNRKKNLLKKLKLLDTFDIEDLNIPNII